MSAGLGADHREPIAAGPAAPSHAGNTDAAGPAEARRIFTITQYNKSVERKMREFPRVWVKGVITQLNVRGRIAYVSIGEFAEGDARPRAVLDTTLWTSQLEVFNLRFAGLPTPLQLRVELKVAFLLESNFWVPTGRFQPRIVDVDENFTLGELAITRQKILERLVKEGLLGRNKEKAIPEPALRIGLVTAPGSAAYKDFTTVLLRSGYAFRIHFAGARMQGESTEPTVIRALQALARLPLDVICIVRGGGSKTDLVYFDSEAICRAIAACPVPVLTGIGHEIDNSLADLVAHADKITPTDCAKYLEALATNCWARLNAYTGELAEAWRMEWQQAWHDVTVRAGAVRREWDARRLGEEARGREQARLLSSGSRRTLREEWKSIRQDAVGLSRGPRKILRLESLRFAHRGQGIGHAWARWRDARDGALREAYARLRERAARLFAGRKDSHRAAARALGAAWARGLREDGWSLSLKERLIHAADPARVLELGFALLRRADGTPVKSIADVRPGDALVGRVKDGEIVTEVKATKEEP